MIQRSERETRVIIVEGINPDMSENDYSRKLQVFMLPTDDICTFFPKAIRAPTGTCMQSTAQCRSNAAYRS